MSEESPSQGTCVIGPLDTIEDADEAACVLFGYSKAELVGLHGSELIQRERHSAVAVVLDQMRHGDVSSVAAAVVRRKDGSPLSVDVTAQRLSGKRLALTVRRRPTGTGQ
jgi:PAS domain S-box-containing protein